MKSILFTIALTLIFAVNVQADDADKPVLQAVSAAKAFIPVGFDDNDQSQLVIAGRFPNTCYQVGPYDVKVDEADHTITVTQFAYVYSGVCLRMLVPYTQTVDLGMLEKGNYQVIDGDSAVPLGKLEIHKATQIGPGTDDYIYAPVEDAFVEIDKNTGKKVAVLHGAFSNSCMSFDKTEVHAYPEVVIVQPVVRFEEQPNCQAGHFAFKKTVELDKVGDGAFLLHVRSMNGKAINKVYAAIN
ncbi:MAG: hypothetical protein H6617_10315 [Bdellovibrionaceae bacterium]|nr:hypothetical protein [Pseudobdellovibrionaceae bacterium]